MKTLLILVVLFSGFQAQANDSTVITNDALLLAKANFNSLSRQTVQPVTNAITSHTSLYREKRRGGFLRGAGTGALIMGGAGVITGLVTPRAEPLRRTDQVAILGISGAITGALFGGIIGALSKN